MRRVFLCILVTLPALGPGSRVLAQSSYSLTLLPPVSGTTASVMAINNRGQTVGFSGTQAVYWNGGVPAYVPGSANLASSYAVDINDSGQIVWQATPLTTGNNPTGQIWLFQNGLNTKVCQQVTGTASAAGLNQAGAVAVNGNGSGCPLTGVWQNGVMTPVTLAAPANCTSTQRQTLTWINDFGTLAATSPQPNCTTSVLGPAAYANGTTTFYTFPSSQNVTPTSLSINNLQEMVGVSAYLDFWLSPTSAIGTPQSPAGWNIAAQATNNVGQTAYIDMFGNLYLTAHGTTQQVIIPNSAAVPALSTHVSLNDGGQIALNVVMGGVQQGALLTPLFSSCGTDVTSKVQITLGKPTPLSKPGLWAQGVSITNTGSSSINGPVSLALDNLAQYVSVYQLAGATVCSSPAGSPYVTASTSSIAAGSSVTAMVLFVNTTNQNITWTPRILAGNGGR